MQFFSLFHFGFCYLHFLLLLVLLLPHRHLQYLQFKCVFFSYNLNGIECAHVGDNRVREKEIAGLGKAVSGGVGREFWYLLNLICLFECGSDLYACISAGDVYECVYAVVSVAVCVCVCVWMCFSVSSVNSYS